ncbi:MAG: BglG family transcription antiterminator [Clostridium sp.]|uniref:BglG family transcription antiterminator n=1 Tax=Clostridium sp. TaxID=1506 RepID=UPI003D6CF734
MDKQTISIIEILIEGTDYITYRCISKKLNVSLSTVIRYIKNLDSYFKENKIRVEKKRGIGIRLILSQSDRKTLKESLNEEDSDYLFPHDRKIIIICELLSMDKPVKTYYFSSVLKVAIGTVRRDLEDVEDWFKQNNLTLKKGMGNGLFVEGEEKSIRQAIVNLLLSNIENKNNYYWNNDFMKPKFFKENLALMTKVKLAKLINYNIVVNMVSIVQKYDRNLKEVIVDGSYFQFIILLCLIIQRKEKGMVIENYKIDDIKKLQQYQYISLLLNEVEKSYKVIVSNSDKYVIMIHFITSGVRELSESNTQITNDRELSMITNRIISNLQNNLNIRLDYDDDFLVRLMIHLKLMLDRQSMEVKVTNNYLDLIKSDYKEIFDVVKSSVDFLSEITLKSVNDEEIGLITIHIVATLLELENNTQIIKVVVVCTSGIGTSRILVEKIKQKINNIEIVATMSSGAINEVNLIKQGVDLIISSVNLETFIIPTAVVNPLMKDEDKLKIYKLIDTISKKKNRGLTSKTPEKVNVESNQKSVEDMLFYMEVIHGILDEFYYEEDVDVGNKDQLIEYVSKQISYSDKMHQIILSKLFKREEYGSTVINDKGLILLHCSAGNYIKLGVVRLKKIIDVSVEKYEEKINTVLIMIVPEEPDDRIVEIFSEISKDLVENEGLVEELFNGSKSAILYKIGKLLSKFIN